jgi:PadR family transcriptional regulator, regulatory protein PadR
LHSTKIMLYLCRMNIENTKAQMRKGVLELCILATLSDKACYATDILESLKGSSLIVVEGTLYPLLTRLKNEGYLSYHWEESKSGPPRKYYALTPEGQATLEELKSAWQGFVESINKIIN